MARLNFSQIDGKDYGVLYLQDHDPTESMVDELPDWEQEILEKAEDEYLSALADLQARIRAKYEPQFEDKRVTFPLRPDPDDLWYS